MPQVAGTFLHTDPSHVCVSQINHFNSSPSGAVFKNSSFVLQRLLLERQECGFLAEGQQGLCILCFPVHFQNYICQYGAKQQRVSALGRFTHPCHLQSSLSLLVAVRCETVSVYSYLFQRNCKNGF